MKRLFLMFHFLNVLKIHEIKMFHMNGISSSTKESADVGDVLLILLRLLSDARTLAPDQ